MTDIAHLSNFDLPQRPLDSEPHPNPYISRLNGLHPNVLKISIGFGQMAKFWRMCFLIKFSKDNITIWNLYESNHFDSLACHLRYWNGNNREGDPHFFLLWFCIGLARYTVAVLMGVVKGWCAMNAGLNRLKHNIKLICAVSVVGALIVFLWVISIFSNHQESELVSSPSWISKWKSQLLTLADFFPPQNLSPLTILSIICDGVTNPCHSSVKLRCNHSRLHFRNSRSLLFPGDSPRTFSVLSGDWAEIFPKA